jgi:orotate phosphoribosyltransferase
MTKTNQEPSQIEKTLLDAIDATRGHFLYESGHHGDLWLDLDALFVDARRARAWAAALAEQALVCQPEIVCGPLTGGAFVAQALAAELGAGFVFAERRVSETGAVSYRVPGSLRGRLQGRRVLLVDDAVNAGSAWRLTLAELADCRAELVGLACLLTLGAAAAQIASQRGVLLFTLAWLERSMWEPDECPLCKAGEPLVDHLAQS